MALGLIVEYNPFHNGHRYHIEASVAATSADGVLCVMSGDFLQRGEPAWVRKGVRTLAALRCGADLVLQIPVAYSCASADIFAHGAVSLLDSTGVVSDLCFGSESGDIDFLEATADRIVGDPSIAADTLERLREGLPFPAARASALVGSGTPMKPNDILGLEYLVSLRRIESPIKAFTILRRGAGYRDSSLPEEMGSPKSKVQGETGCGAIASATAIRASVRRSIDPVEAFMPQAMVDGLREELDACRFPVSWEGFDGTVLALLRRLSVEEIASCRGNDKILAAKLKAASTKVGTVRDLAEAVKTKNLTWTRIYRAISAVLLGLAESAGMLLARRPGYIRVLGFNSRGRELLAEIRRKSSVPVVANLPLRWKAFNKFNARARAERRECASEEAFMADLEMDLTASRIYASCFTNARDRAKEWDFESPVMV